MTMKQKSGLILGAAVATALACSANATVLHYNFDSGSHYDFVGGASNVVTGNFDYDNVAGTFSNVNYDRGGTVFTVASSTGPGAGIDEIYFGDTASADYDVYQFATSLAAGGTDLITAGYHPSIVIDAGGSVTAAGGTPGVPEPASWALMLVGVGFAGAMVRRRAGALAL